MIAIPSPAGLALLSVALTAVVALSAVALVVVLGRGRAPHALPVQGQARIEMALIRFDFWLEWHGVGRRRRRDLRDELRVNLVEAAAHDGLPAAVAALGPLRTMAAEVAGRPGPRPRWTTGWVAACVVGVVVVLVELLMTAAWFAGATASGAPRVEGGLPGFPGSLLSLSRGDDSGFEVLLQPGWLLWSAALLAFVVGARPWLALGQRGQPGRRANDG